MGLFWYIIKQMGNPIFFHSDFSVFDTTWNWYRHINDLQLAILPSSGFYLIAAIIFKDLITFLVISVHTSSKLPSDKVSNNF